jgi:hypothetical protein
MYSFLSSALDESSPQFNASVAFTPGESTASTQLNWRLGWRQRWAVRFGEEIDLMHVPRIETLFLGSPSRSLVSIPTELPRLHHNVF